MTEKRFSQKDEDDWEILDRNKHFAYAHSGYQAGKIIQELNELVETNRELYKKNKELKKESYGNLDGLETYKALYLDLSEKYSNLEADYDDLKKENGQLKSVVKEVIELLSEEVDLFSDKATEHDINAYIELKELDNKDAYYMATATKKSIKLLKGVADD